MCLTVMELCVFFRVFITYQCYEARFCNLYSEMVIWLLSDTLFLVYIVHVVSGNQHSSCSKCESKFDHSQVENKLDNSNVSVNCSNWILGIQHNRSVAVYHEKKKTL